MPVENVQIISQLKSCKERGLSYYQAAQELLSSGYSLDQITAATDNFDYDGTSSSQTSKYVPAVKEQAVRSAPATDKLDREYEKAGNSILADKEHSKRIYSYIGLPILAGGFTAELYRLWLASRLFSNGVNPQYLWENNFGQLFLFWTIGAMGAVVGLRLYFRSLDKRHKQNQDASTDATD